MRGSDHWYEDCVVYAVDVGRFSDSDGDGVGDFPGLTDRLDYLNRLGVDCLWMLPFYPSPGRDNGYDVADYYGVDERFGDLGDFTEFVGEARHRGLHVVVDLVVNHTSDRHPWFREARENPDSKYRDYYVWTDDPESVETDAEPVLPSREDGVWTYDDVAGAYYFHRFYGFEPGLDLSNPDVRDEIRSVMGYWLRLGVDGFRLPAASHLLDAASHLRDAEGVESTRPDDPHEVLRDFRQFVERRTDDAVLLGEVDAEPEAVGEYFGDEGDELTMLFNSVLDRYLFLGLARESAEAVHRGLKLLPPVPAEGQWVNFLRHLDELDLGRLTESERRDVFEAFAPDEDMRIYGRGVRRRLAPMLEGDERRIRLALSLLFSLPGAPMLVYGDEIGMGDDLSREGRTSVRAPMQWSDARNAGFSDAPSDRLVQPVIADGEFGYERVNVADAEFDRDSLLDWVQRLVRVRKETPEFGRGEFRPVETESAWTFVHRSEWERSVAVAVHNLADEAVDVSFSLPGTPSLVDVFANREYDPLAGDDLEYEFTVDPYGYRWLRPDTAHSAVEAG
jgi:maltose alpha-D-glucosyltransferase/alpha-amylase